MKNFTGIGIGLILLALLRLGLKYWNEREMQELNNRPSMIQRRDSIMKRILQKSATVQEEAQEPIEEESLVYYCQGKNAKTYHFDPCCENLNRCLKKCHSEIIGALEHEARFLGKKPCSECVPLAANNAHYTTSSDSSSQSI